MLMRSIIMLNSEDVAIRFSHISREPNRWDDAMEKMSSPHDPELLFSTIFRMLC